MRKQIIQEIQELNPWLENPDQKYIDLEGYLPRVQQEDLLDPEWDTYWTLLIGPRRAGKTTLGHYLSDRLLEEGRYQNLLYLNFDFASLRNEFNSPIFLKNLMSTFELENPIIFLDEVQRLETPGLLLKAIADLKWPIKMIASGSSQLEIKSRVQEHLTGREIEFLVLPLSIREAPDAYLLEEEIIYGGYPQVALSQNRERILKELYKRYIKKDIIEILQVSKPAVIEKLIILIAHSSGQLVNYQQLSVDCNVSISTIKSYLAILEETYILVKVLPFVGNKRTEVTANPKFYFIDNGFRNQALRNFSDAHLRPDIGLLIESFVFQELYKYKCQMQYDFDIFYWRTKAGAEVDFILYKNNSEFVPVEVKYREMKRSGISRGYRSFLQAYQPKVAIVVTKSWVDQIKVEGCLVHFIPLSQLNELLKVIEVCF